MLQQLAEHVVAQVPLSYQNGARQFIKFAITGTIGAIVDFGTYNFLTRGLDWQTVYNVSGVEIIAANLVSVFLAILSNFILNKYWTFKDHSSNVAKQGASYFALNGFTFVLNQLLTSFFIFQVPLLGVFGSQQDNVGKALAIGIILFVNFFGSRLLIFRQRPTVH